MRYCWIIIGVWAKLCFALPAITLVESVPLDTIYGQKSIPQTEAVWTQMIQAAKQSIDIGAFYINSTPNSSMARIIDALNTAATHGVTIHVLLDQSFAKQSTDSVKLLNAAIQIRYIDMKQLAGGVMHAKYMVIDRHVVFIGSQNFDWKAISQNHEMGVYVDNARLANTIEQLFLLDWQLALLHSRQQAWPIVDHDHVTDIVNYQHPITMGDAQLFPAFSPKSLTPPHFDWELTQLIYLLDHAKQSIHIQVYQYSDKRYSRQHKKWLALNQALIAAAKRGVTVQLIVSDVMLHDRALADLKQLSQENNITIKMSHIPLYQGHTIAYARVEHAKYMIIDRQICWVGTGNWSNDYFYASRDLTLILNSTTYAKQLESVFQQDWNGPYVSVIK